MQDIHLQTGGGNPTASRLFAAAAAAAAGGRHLRPLHHLHLHHHPHPSNQALKCPRCDSLNTKFCYYNNYNLSQPRHFCKSCRRYWTKGGVLRNVPIGGGCRKSRRPSSSSKPPPLPSPSATKPKPGDDSAATDAANNNHHSSSDSSTLTAATPAEIPTAIFHEYGGSCLEKPSTGAATATLYGDVGISMDHHVGGGRDDVSTSMLTETGNFTSLMGSTVEITPFGYAGVLTLHDPAPQQQPNQQEMVVVDGFGTLDWQGSGDENNGVDRGEGLFDMTGAVDHAYWSQQNQWTAAGVDVDHHHQQEGGGGLFLP